MVLNGLLAGLPLAHALGLVSAVTLVLSLAALLFFKKGAGPGAKNGAAKPGSTAATNGIVAKQPKADTRQRCSIVFGTQTGTAERFAKSLRAQLDGKYGSTTAFDLVDVESYKYEEQLPKERLALFLMATYGDGEPTDSATGFMDWLASCAQSAAAEEQFKGLHYGVFGLGNRQYEHFAAVGKKIHKLLGEMGAAAVVRRGDGDDDQDIDADFDAWSMDLFAALDKSELVQENKAGDRHSIDLKAESIAAYDVEDVHDAPQSSVDQWVTGGGLHHSSPFLARITAVKELHGRGSDRSCVHVEVDVSGSDIAYEAGDHVAVFAENSASVVEAAAKLLGLPLSHCFQLVQPLGNPHCLPEPFHGPVTLRCALARYADLLSAPSKAALQALAAFAANPEEAARLRRLACIEGKEEYHGYVAQAKRSLLQVMQEFPSAKPTLGAFFGSIAPHLQPRFYSISSSPKQHPHSIHITCAVVKETMPCGRVHEGVASNWLARARKGGTVPVFVRRSSFKLPADPAVPVVMVGPGTGLAPFRGFVQERAALAESGAQLGPAHLFFGCRNRKHDFIYQSELEGAVAQGAISQLHVAFSREGKFLNVAVNVHRSGRPQKDYVQHHMEARGAEVWDVLRPAAGGYLYVCGDARNMAKDVHRTVHDIIVKATGCSNSEAEAQLKRLSDSGRYHKDVW
ncbi:hypothetical protein N2152v2_008896 [Parachlorella kessleri]